MIEIRFNSFTNMGFVQAIQKLANLQLPVKASYRVARIVALLESAQKRIGEDFQREILPKLVKPVGDAPLTETDEKANAELQKVFGEKIYKIERDKLTYDMLGESRLSGAELSYLAPFFEDVETLPAQAPVIPINAPARSEDAAPVA